MYASFLRDPKLRDKVLTYSSKQGAAIRDKVLTYSSNGLHGLQDPTFPNSNVLSFLFSFLKTYVSLLPVLA